MATDGYVVADLNQVVDFGAFLNPSTAEAGAIDSGVRADLDIVVDLDGTCLRDFFMTTFTELVSKTLGTDHGAVVQDHSFAHRATLSHGDMGIKVAVITKCGLFADEAARFDDASSS